jgi:hypothetical protein
MWPDRRCRRGTSVTPITPRNSSLPRSSNRGMLGLAISEAIAPTGAMTGAASAMSCRRRAPLSSQIRNYRGQLL